MIWNNDTATIATGGKTDGNWQADSVSIDSRTMQPGALFVAIAGERVDGHDYVAEALRRGAAAAMVHQPVANVPPEKLLIVDDTLRGLQALGRYARNQTRARVIGLTGSVGKTSTKEMLKLMLATFGHTYASAGNYNNHIGTPLSLANLPPDADFAVLEMGMNHAGEIAELTQMVRPEIAIITNVEAVHLEYFASLEAIAEAKSEIFSGVTADGAAILNADNTSYQHCRNAVEAADIQRIISVGRAAGADVRLTALHTEKDGMQLAANIGGQSVEYRLAAVGEHWAAISLIALAVADRLGLDVQKAAAALAEFHEVAGRGQVHTIPITGGEWWLVDDSYNASPASMRAAFARVRALAEARPGVKRRIAVLGEMLELGETAPRLHAELAGALVEAGFDRVHTTGALMTHLQAALPADMQGPHTQSAADLLPLLKTTLTPGDMLLIKGSHGSKVYELVAGLMVDIIN